jgi:hypothetical protein
MNRWESLWEGCRAKAFQAALELFPEDLGALRSLIEDAIRLGVSSRQFAHQVERQGYRHRSYRWGHPR